MPNYHLSLTDLEKSLISLLGDISICTFEIKLYDAVNNSSIKDDEDDKNYSSLSLDMFINEDYMFNYLICDSNSGHDYTKEIQLLKEYFNNVTWR